MEMVAPMVRMAFAAARFPAVAAVLVITHGWPPQFRRMAMVVQVDLGALVGLELNILVAVLVALEFLVETHPAKLGKVVLQLDMVETMEPMDVVVLMAVDQAAVEPLM